MICRWQMGMLLIKVKSMITKGNNMKSMMMLGAVIAAAMMMTTGCANCHKGGACTKPAAMTCDGGCCKDATTCAKCCTDAAGCAKCCHKS